MKVCYLDAFSGISGDMTVAALVDAGADAAAILDGLSSLNTGAEFSFEPVRRKGIAALKFHVRGGEQRAHRHLPQIVKMIETSKLPEIAKQNAVAVFTRLGEAEAKTHGVPIEKVHFHEVGAVDSISDIAGACHALALLGVERIVCSPLNTGSGTVNTEHGLLPVPAPATSRLLAGVPVYARGPEAELTTPTGAALVATLSQAFGQLPAMTLQRSGYGAGDRDFSEHANILRVLIGEIA
jgi:pyridinium-3,5-bisthiocarboxylic acid mononucleotide nickel chelatase